MSDDMPWFPFWVADFLTSRRVAAMSMEEVGTYVMLLCHQWVDGPLPDDPELLARLTRADVNNVRTTLQRCFDDVQGTWVNERLEAVREEQREKRQRFVRAGKASGRSRRKRKGRKENEQRSNNVAVSFEQSESESESDTEEQHSKIDSSNSGDVDNSGTVGPSPLRLLHAHALQVLSDMKHPTSKRATARTLEARFLATDEDGQLLDPCVKGLNQERRAELISSALLEYGDQTSEWNASHFAAFVRRLRKRPKPNTEAAAVHARGEPSAGGYKPSPTYTESEPTDLAKIDARALLESFGVQAPRDA